jgi:predicted nucleic acid-binding Zn ribbon protein
MARPPILSRLRRRGRPAPPESTSEDVHAVAEDGTQTAAPRRRPLPAPGRLRRERRALVRQREERIRDLGGLVLEMYRRDDYRPELVDERCAELAGLEERLYEVDSLLRAALGARRPAPAARCACGTPIPWGSRFCATCGRPLAASPATACETCGAALSGDARFCAACGTAVGPADEPADPEGGAE